jgi:hypothetical protein
VASGGQTGSAKCTFKVDVPTVNHFTGTETTDNPPVHASPNAFSARDVLSFGAATVSPPAVNAASPSYGITFDASVSATALEAGSVELVQLTNMVATDTFKPPAPVSKLNTHGYVLDDSDNGQVPSAGPQGTGNNAQPLGTNDSPYGPLYSRSETSVQRTSGFQTYLMYQPTNGIWVTLSERIKGDVDDF